MDDGESYHQSDWFVPAPQGYQPVTQFEFPRYVPKFTGRFVITDHGTQFRRQFRSAMKKMGMIPVQARVRAPYLNGKIERAPLGMALRPAHRLAGGRMSETALPRETAFSTGCQARLVLDPLHRPGNARPGRSAGQTPFFNGLLTRSARRSSRSLPADAVRQVIPEELPALTPDAITKRRDLAAQLEKVRKTGIAYDMGEYNIGFFYIGAPVFDVTGNVAAGIGITGVLQGGTSGRFREWEPMVLGCAAKTGADFGYAGDMYTEFQKAIKASARDRDPAPGRPQRQVL